MGRLAGISLALSLASAGCSQAPAGKRYPLEGQILAVNVEQQALTIKHGDIAGFMPAMTMTFPVTKRELMTGRVPGELVKATLEVTDFLGSIVALEHAGTAPLPPPNEVGLAAGQLQTGDAVPDTAFIDQSNRRRSFGEWKGAPVVVTFVYTRCPLPNFCPLMDQNFAALQGAIKKDAALRGKARLVSISFDPAHDTPAVLAAHAKKLKADPEVWTFLTADPATVDGFAGRLGVGVIRETDVPGTIAHNLRTALIAADGTILRFYAGGDWTPSTLLADLRTAVGTK